MKSIPIALQEHLEQVGTTTCLLCRVECVGPFAGTVLGFASLDADLRYDDGSGAVTYRADNGFTPERLQATADLGVDNTEIQGWVTDTGITREQIFAGLFNFARVRVYRVNYMDLAAGHEVVATGTLGETVFGETGWRTEYRSLKQQLKQPINYVYSLTCVAKYGSTTGRWPCGAPLVWVVGAVTAADAIEPRRRFTDSALLQQAGYFVPGVVRFTSGRNAGFEVEVVGFSAGAVELALLAPFPVAEGDGYEIRQDCSKLARDEVHGCKHHFGAEWVNHFRGQPDIPVADQAALMIPGAQL